jgi:DNA repair protein RadC
MSAEYRTIRIKVPALAAAEPGGAPVPGPAEAAAAVRAFMERERVPQDREVFGILALNARGKVTGASVVSVGTLSSALVHPREVFRPALALNAASIICWHTHPSGELDPSDEDFAITERLGQAGQVLGVPVLDNLVLTAGDHLSLGGEAPQ